MGQHKTRESSADRRIVEEAHTALIERLAVLKPYRILYIADAQDLGERAEHLQQVLRAVLDYVCAIVADTGHVAPGGSIDRKYLLGLISDLAGDVAGSIANAADDLAAGRRSLLGWDWANAPSIVALGNGRLAAGEAGNGCREILTPGLSPLVNSTPAASKALTKAVTVDACADRLPGFDSSRFTVGSDTADASAR